MKRYLFIALLGCSSFANASDFDFSNLSMSTSGACQKVNTGAAKAIEALSTATVAAGTWLKASGVGARLHSSGELITATAEGGYLEGTLGTIGTEAVALLTAPETLIIGGTVAATAGAAIAYCHYSEK
jgi:hypothetical protein